MKSLTFNNIVFDVSRVSRTELDSIFTEPLPIPPTKKVMIWGGVLEDSYLFDDPTYIEAMSNYNRIVYNKERELFYSAISYDKDVALSKVDRELYELTGDMLVSLLSDEQILELFELVMYQSTVTMKGLEKASNMFNVRKYDTPVYGIKFPDSEVSYSAQFRDRLVAKDLGYTWTEFCLLDGQEQSNLVMVYVTNSILHYLEENKQ